MWQINNRSVLPARTHVGCVKTIGTDRGGLLAAARVEEPVLRVQSVMGQIGNSRRKCPKASGLRHDSVSLDLNIFKGFQTTLLSSRGFPWRHLLRFISD